MEQRKQHGTGGRYPGPSLRLQERAQGGQISRVCQCAVGEVAHQNDGQYDFVGRPTEKKGGKDYSVQSKQTGEGIQKSGAMAEQGGIAYGHIGHDPDNGSGRSSHDCCPPQYR